MKILYVITGLGLGGAERVVADLADEMHGLGHCVKIAYLKGDIVVRPQSDRIEIIALKLNQAQDLLKASRLFRQLIRDFQPDVVHAHMVHANIFARLNRVGLNIPKLICTAHSSNEGGRVRMMIYKLTNFLSDINTNVSDEAAKRFIHLGAFNQHNMITVYNGIDLNKYNKLDTHQEQLKQALGLKPDCKVVLAVGRFNILKDYPNLLSAIKYLKDHYHDLNFQVLIAGDGELRQQIEDTISALNIASNVTLLGRRNDIVALMSFADVFTLSSAFEGFGLVVAEAMACQSYVVATDCGGVKEVMGETGSLVPIQDSVALGQAIYDALQLSPTDLEENNRLARARIEAQFSLTSSVKKWLDLYAAH